MILQVLPLRGYEKRVCIYIYIVYSFTLFLFQVFLFYFILPLLKTVEFSVNIKKKKIFIFGC